MLNSRKVQIGLAGVLAIAAVWLIAPNQAVATTKTFSSSSGAWLTTGNWTPSGLPTSTDDVLINAGTTTMTLTAANMAIQFMTSTNTSSRILENSTGGTTASNLTLGTVDGSGNLINVNPASGTPTSTIRNGSTGALNLILGASGNFNVGLAGAGLTISSSILESGAQSITKTGPGTMTLSGNSAYSGGTSLNAGTLTIGNSSTGTPPSITAGPVGTGTLTLNGGILSSSGTRTLGNAITLAAATNTIIASNFTLSGVISGGAGNTLMKTGTATSELTLSGNNDYTGQTIIDSTSATGRNTIVIRHANALGTTAGNTEVRTSGSTNGARLELQSSITTNEQVAIGGLSTAPASISYRIVADSTAGPNEIAGDITTLGGGSNYSIRADGSSSNAFTISGDIREISSGNSTLVLSNGSAIGTGIISGEIKQDSANSIWSVFKQGAGTWTLSGNNAYAGTTTVNAGKLLIDGTHTGGAAYTVDAAGTLGGTGSISAAVAVNGILSPGSSIESLGMGDLILGATSTFDYELNTASLNGDLVVAGALNIGAGATLTLNDVNPGTLTPGEKLTLINYTGGGWNLGTFTYLSNPLPDGATFMLGSNMWQIDYDDATGGSNFTSDYASSGFVTLTVVPEPSSMILIFIGMIGLALVGMCHRKRTNCLNIRQQLPGSDRNYPKMRDFMGRCIVFNFRVAQIGLLATFAASGPVAATAATVAWTNTGASTAWYTNTNWSPNTASNQWLTTDLAQFNNTGTANTAGINMGTASLSIGAIEVSSARTRNLTIGNSSTTAGTLTLNGINVNGVDNTILHNASSFTQTLQNNETGSGKTMGVVLANTTDNVVLIESTGGVTISSIISGADKHLTLQGGGTGSLTLSGANTFTGGVTVNTGTLVIGNSSNGTPPTITDGPVGTGSITLNGGILSTGGNRTLGNAISLNATTNTIHTPTSNQTFTLTGVISGGNGNALIKTGNATGTSTLNIDGNNTYDGQTIIEASSSNERNTIVIRHANALGSTVGNTEVRTSGSNGSRLELAASFVTNEQIAIGGLNTAPGTMNFRIVGDSIAALGPCGIAGDITTLGGGSNYSIRADGADGFTISGNIRETSGSNSTLVLGNTTAQGIGVISGVIKEDSVGSIWNVHKRDLGTWRLSGNNTYVGTTTVNGGILLVNGTNSGGGAYSVASGATLGGGGSVGGSAVTVQSGGMIAPGASIGTLTAGSVDLDGTLAIEFNGASIDKLNVTGALDITGATLTFTNLGDLTGSAFVFAQYGSLEGNPFTTVNGLPGGYGIDYNYQNNNQIALVLTTQLGDFDGDGDVDGADFIVWQTNFPAGSGHGLATGDADGDTDVDGADFAAWQSSFPFGPGPAASPVPEPQGVIILTGLAAIGMCVWQWDRRRRPKVAVLPVR